MKKHILIIGVCLFVSVFAKAQGDAFFSQYNSAPLQLNPANAGLFHGNFRFNTNFRRQWENVSNVYQTIGASGDFQVAKDVFDSDMFGMGFSVIQDKSGISEMSNLDASISLSYTKTLDASKKHYISLGANVGYGQRSLITSALRWGNQWTTTGFNPLLDNGEPSLPDESVSLIDFGAGVNWFYSNTEQTFKAYAGIAMFHLNDPEVTFTAIGTEQLNKKRVFNAGIERTFSRGFMAFLPSIMIVDQGPTTYAQFGSDLKFILSKGTRQTGYLSETTFSIGMYHRWADAFIPVVKMQKGGFTLGISYDLEVGNITRVTNGMEGPEFSLAFKSGYKKGARKKPVNSKFM